MAAQVLNHDNNRYWALVAYELSTSKQWTSKHLATNVYGAPIHPCHVKAYRFNLVGSALHVSYNWCRDDKPNWEKFNLAGNNFYSLMWDVMRALPVTFNNKNKDFYAASVVHEYCQEHSYDEVMRIFTKIRHNFCRKESPYVTRTTPTTCQIRP